MKEERGGFTNQWLIRHVKGEYMCPLPDTEKAYCSEGGAARKRRKGGNEGRRQAGRQDGRKEERKEGRQADRTEGKKAERQTDRKADRTDGKWRRWWLRWQ
jgi:hypothetical protein